jgi:hypothetical protein
LEKTKDKHYHSVKSKLYSSVYARVHHQAMAHYESLINNPRRKPCVRSKYFDNKKVFLDEFWTQILRRNFADRRRRLAFYVCAIDLIKNTRCEPEIKHESGKKFYEFYGVAKNGEKFVVHLRQSKDNIYMVSCFPK